MVIPGGIQAQISNLYTQIYGIGERGKERDIL